MWVGGCLCELSNLLWTCFTIGGASHTAAAPVCVCVCVQFFFTSEGRTHWSEDRWCRMSNGDTMRWCLCEWNGWVSLSLHVIYHTRTYMWLTVITQQQKQKKELGSTQVWFVFQDMSTSFDHLMCLLHLLHCWFKMDVPAPAVMWGDWTDSNRWITMSPSWSIFITVTLLLLQLCTGKNWILHCCPFVRIVCVVINVDEKQTAFTCWERESSIFTFTKGVMFSF